MFNGKAIILLLLAIVIGGGAAYYANDWILNQQGPEVISKETTVNVVIAAREIPYGQALENSHLRTVPWPESAVPKDSFQKTDEIIGMLVNQSVVVGEPLLASRVVEKLAGSRLSSLIAPNKRAITVRVNDVAGVAGFLLPGNYVDILATRIVNKRALTETLLQNIKVLAIDQKANPDKDDPVLVRAVTLEADLEEASMLVGATEEGSIQLVLRNPQDSTKIAKKSPIEEIAIPKIRRRNKTNDVTIIRGTSVNRAKVKL